MNVVSAMVFFIWAAAAVTDAAVESVALLQQQQRDPLQQQAGPASVVLAAAAAGPGSAAAADHEAAAAADHEAASGSATFGSAAADHNVAAANHKAAFGSAPADHNVAAANHRDAYGSAAFGSAAAAHEAAAAAAAATGCQSIPCPFQESCSTFAFDCMGQKLAAQTFDTEAQMCEMMQDFITACGARYCCGNNHGAANDTACQQQVTSFVQSNTSQFCNSAVGLTGTTMANALCHSLAGSVGAVCAPPPPAPSLLQQKALSDILQTRAAHELHAATSQGGYELEAGLDDKCL